MLIEAVSVTVLFVPASRSKEACSLLAAWLFSDACIKAPFLSLLAASALLREYCCGVATLSSFASASFSAFPFPPVRGEAPAAVSSHYLLQNMQVRTTWLCSKVM